MAAVTGTVQSVFGFRTPSGPKKTTAGAAIECCDIAVTYTGTYATAGGKATIANVHTAIAAARRDGKTIAVISAGFSAPGDLAGVAVGAITVSNSTNTVNSTLTQADMATELADGALGVFNSGVMYSVSYTAV